MFTMSLYGMFVLFCYLLKVLLLPNKKASRDAYLMNVSKLVSDSTVKSVT